MKRITGIFFFSFMHLVSHSQNVNFAWAKQIGGTDNDEGHSIAADATGNVYITGLFAGGGGTTGNAFVSKYNTSGILLWAKQFIGARAYGTSITIDASGNILTTGLFDGTVDFDPGPGTFNLIAISDHQFISKLDAAGNFIWAKQIGGNVFGQNVYVSSIATDSQGNVYTSGSVDGPSIDFDPGPGVYMLNNPYHWNQIFVSKLDAAGNFVWAKQMEETPVGYASHGSWSNSIAVDAIGNVYTTGRFANQIDFDPGPGVFYLYHTTENCDAFISKFDAAGNFVWAKQLKGQTPDAAAGGNSIVLDASGNVYTAGGFGDTVDFDPGPGTLYLNSSDGSGYISKLDATGNFISVKAFGAVGASITLDASGNIYSAGYFYGTVDFDPGPGVFNLTAAGMSDIFISKSDASGNFIWAKQIGGTGYDFGLSIALDAARNIFTTGRFVEQVDFDPGPGIYNLTSDGSDDAFVLKLNQCANSTSSSITISACNVYILNGQTYTASGIYIQTLTNTTGCDSIITLNLTISGSYSTLNATACNSYSWNGQTYTSTGIYRDTLTTSGGCDSIIALNLVINQKSFSVINAAICSGQNYSGHTTPGTYIDTLVAANGCDSIRTIHLTVKSTSFSTITQSICQGQTYSGHSASGAYIDTLVAANGCDSVQTLHLTVYPAYSFVIDTTICYGQHVEGHHSSGTYNNIYQTINGCDSARTIKLTVLPEINPSLGKDTSICTGDSLVLYPGQFTTYAWQDGSAKSHLTIKQPGLYSVMVTDNCGSATDEILVKEGICDIYFPSAFTPNNDGKNDWFKVLGASHVSDFHLAVYDRWGQRVFETKDYTKGWAGKLNGQLLDTGIFIWYCEFKKAGNNNIVRMKGTVVLIR